ncbi:hypothetical protein N431DRAFT_465549 [Stipitochalara longipes BDJ]|nr:hypothetical protein N431DRAFT_465549 [Stipitochalara longipes BDJ]
MGSDLAKIKKWSVPVQILTATEWTDEPGFEHKGYQQIVVFDLESRLSLPTKFAFETLESMYCWERLTKKLGIKIHQSEECCFAKQSSQSKGKKVKTSRIFPLKGWVSPRDIFQGNFKSTDVVYLWVLVENVPKEPTNEQSTTPKEGEAAEDPKNSSQVTSAMSNNANDDLSEVEDNGETEVVPEE